VYIDTLHSYIINTQRVISSVQQLCNSSQYTCAHKSNSFTFCWISYVFSVSLYFDPFSMTMNASGKQVACCLDITTVQLPVLHFNTYT